MSAAVADGAGANGDATTTTRDGGAAAAANMTGALALLDSYVPGAKCWFMDKEKGWISGEVTRKALESEEVTLEFVDENGNTSTTKTTLALLDKSLAAQAQDTSTGGSLPPLRNPPVLEATEDLTNLSHLNEPSVLHSILHRYSLRQIYTYSGIVLVAVNPFSSLSVYSPSIVQAYAGRRVGELEPHVFAIAEEAYRCMLASARDTAGGTGASGNQTIIVSGESGAGKTVSAKYIMRYFATVEDPSRPARRKHASAVPQAGGAAAAATGGGAVAPNAAAPPGLSEVEEQILATNPIMEAFGNAKTTRNDNSSRFGKYIEILFDETQTIVGARIRTYLLERSRLVYQPDTERNYHIFYQLLAGAPSSERKDLGLESASTFTYLNQGGESSLEINGVDDAEEFKATQRALSTVGISIERQWQIFKVLAALLHIGNMSITAVRNDAILNDDDKHLALATELLGINRSEFRQWLLKRQIVMRSEKVVSNLTAAQANVVKDSVAKYIYACLFDWLVAVVNESLAGAGIDDRVRNFIGVLDIYGFEHFKKNSFEQFCINYANEKLQQEFNAHVFKLEQEEYVREEINWKFIDYADNQPTIDLIEGKLGVLSLLDEESRMPSGSDANLCQKLHSTHGTNKAFKKPRFGGNNAFTIAHYALDVTYDSDGFIDKNRDTVPDEHLALLNATENPFLKEVLDRAVAAAEAANKPAAYESAPVNKRASVMPVGAAGVARKGGAARKPTLGSIFKGSLISLMDTIDSTNAHYIRCIKPNEQKAAWEFDPNMVLSQLRACGVLETIRISCAGYPTRWTFEEFAERYYMLATSDSWGPEPRELCKRILDRTINDADKYQVGKTKIFFRAGLLARFEQLRADRLNALATIIQKNLKRYVAIKRYARIRQATLDLQCAWRAKLARREADRRRQEASALLIQRNTRGYLQRLRFQRARSTVLAVQSLARGLQVRASYREHRLHNAAATLQSLFRGLLVRQQHIADQRKVVLVQSCIRRRQAKRQLRDLKQEARSAVHYKEVTYRLENKVVELTQSLQKRTVENKELSGKLKALEQQVLQWTTKYDELDSHSRGLRAELDKPSVPLEEFKELDARKQELDAQLAESLRKIEAQDTELDRLRDEIERKTKESEERAASMQALTANANSEAEDAATVASLRTELASLREQLTRQLASGAAKPRPDGGIFNMATGARAAGDLNGLGLDGAPAKRRTRRHSADLLDAPPGDEEDPERWDRSPRPASMASPYESSVKRFVGKLPDVYDDPVEEIMRLLEEEEPLDEDVLSGIIRFLKVPVPNLQNPSPPKEVLFPAHLISLVTNEMWKYGMMRESERFLANVMQTIQQHVMAFEGDEVIVPGIFWLTNVHEVLSFVCIAESDILQGIGPGQDGIGHEYDWEDYERLVTIVKHDLDSLEYNIYHTWMQETKKRLHKMVIPALIESQSLPGFVTDSGGRLFNRLVGGNSAPAHTMDDILNLLNKVWKSLKSYYVEHTVVQQAVTELLKLIGVSSFNDLLMRRNFSSWKRAMQIQYNITRLEEWCKSHDMPEGTLQLEHLMQATKLLQLKKATLADIEIIYDVCWMLTPTQIQKLIANYYVADYENPLSPEILRAVNSRVIAGDKNDHLLLPPEVEEAGPYEVPLPREVTGIETYIPAWLHVPHLRQLVMLLQVS